jgi:hypothetical protein
MFKTSIQTVSSAATLLVGTAFFALSAVAIAIPAPARTPAGFQAAHQDRQVAMNTTARPAG